MNSKKRFSILLSALFLMVSFVSAVDVNDTIRINAEYREGGVLTAANATLYIYLPSGLVNINNQSMTADGVGKFYYDYVIPDYEGEYTALAVFYKSGTYVGNESQSFDVGDINQIKFDACPTGTQGWLSLWFILIGMVILTFIGYFSNIPALSIIPPIILIFMFLVTIRCGTLFGYITIGVGLMLLIMSVNQRR